LSPQKRGDKDGAPRYPLRLNFPPDNLAANTFFIGALAGGGKGAAIGGAAGAGVGGGVQVASKSQQIKLPPETVLNFSLQAPVTVAQAPNPSANWQKLSDSQ
jgi:hypothetical protein